MKYVSIAAMDRATMEWTAGVKTPPPLVQVPDGDGTYLEIETIDGSDATLLLSAPAPTHG